MNLQRTFALFKIEKGERKRELAWILVRELAKGYREPFWDFVRNLNLRPEQVKEVMRFLEENGELEIKRSTDGRRLWVLTLKDIKRNPVRLDRWLMLRRLQER